MTNVDADLIAKLREVADRQEIHATLMRYCRGVDRGDEELINSAFHPGAIDDHGTPQPATALASMVAGLDRQFMHFSGNYLIELEGDTAFVESYFLSFAPQEEDGVASTRTRAGRYLDRFERRDGEWKITYRRVVDEWARVDEVKTVPEGVGVHGSLRGPDDAVFHIREFTQAPA